MLVCFKCCFNFGFNLIGLFVDLVSLAAVPLIGWCFVGGKWQVGGGVGVWVVGQTRHTTRP